MNRRPNALLMADKNLHYRNHARWRREHSSKQLCLVAVSGR